MTTPIDAGELLGYARVSTERQSLDQQFDALESAGVARERIYSDKLSGRGIRINRPGMRRLLDYARSGDTIVTVGVDRLGRDAAEVMLTIRELGERGIILRSLREGIDTSNSTGRMIAGVMASLAELEAELGRERREAARLARASRNLPTGRPKALTAEQAALARRMRESGESIKTIALNFEVSRATVYRAIAHPETVPDDPQSETES